MATRAEPKSYTGGRVLHVYPDDHQGPREEPSFVGLKHAYYGPGRGDWTAVRMNKLQPGDTILVHAGLSARTVLNYVDPLSGHSPRAELEGLAANSFRYAFQDG